MPHRPYSLAESPADACGAENVTLSVSCDSVEAQEGGVLVKLSDGQRIQADLVVAADGTHSRLRTTWQAAK